MSRYAIYGVPGIEPEASGVAVRLREAADAWYATHPDITEHPRRYGFHATLKPPFKLAPDRTLAELEAALTAFAGTRHPVMLHSLRPTALGAFRALVPAGPTHQVDALAADVVREFEPFRAPLRPEDIARRRPEHLTPRQRELLDSYGYPYVLDEFQLHLTLTDSLRGSLDDTDAVDQAIAQHFAEFDGRDVPLTSITLLVEPERGANFRVHSIHPFLEAA